MTGKSDFEARRDRLEELQIQKRRYDKRYFNCTLVAFANILPVLLYAWLTVVAAAGGERSGASAFFALSTSAAYEVMLLLSVFRRSWKFTAISTVCAVFWCLSLGEMLPYPFLINAVTALPHRGWEQLKQEDGFPFFDITIEERQAHELQMRQIQQGIAAARAEEQSHSDGMETI
jgi:hypothetical protein